MPEPAPVQRAELDPRGVQSDGAGPRASRLSYKREPSWQGPAEREQLARLRKSSRSRRCPPGLPAVNRYDLRATKPAAAVALPQTLSPHACRPDKPDEISSPSEPPSPYVVFRAMRCVIETRLLRSPRFNPRKLASPHGLGCHTYSLSFSEHHD